MAREIRLKPAARRDLDEIHAWSARNFGLAQAERYIRIIQVGLENVARHPMTAPNADSLRSGLRRLAVESHVVFFRYDSKNLTVIPILHGRMDPERHLS